MAGSAQFSATSAPDGTPPGHLTNIVYRSRAVEEMTPAALLDLVTVAKARNDQAAVSGLLLHANGRFFQWLEGPPANVDRIMRSIYRDSRHTDIEVLREQPAAARTFGNWGMKLATPGSSLNPWRKEAIEPPAEVVEALRSHPDTAAMLLTRLADVTTRPDQDRSGLEVTRQAVLPQRTADILKSVIRSTILPRLVNEVAQPGRVRRPLTDARAADLAELLVGSDEHAAMQLITEIRGGESPGGLIFTRLLEPAARKVGDMWNDDICSEFDLTLGLCRLQTAVRLLSGGSIQAPMSRRPRPSVLIVPEPGELHRLGAALDTSTLGAAGWEPHSEYPGDDDALQEMLAANWFDVLDLSLSVALRRERWLARMSDTIAAARRASQNPDLVVVVGGRVFAETKRAGVHVGADLSSRTSGDVDRFILRSLGGTYTAAGTHTAAAEAVATPS